jgi:hypothetical protein
MSDSDSEGGRSFTLQSECFFGMEILVKRVRIGGGHLGRIWDNLVGLSGLGEVADL